ATLHGFQQDFAQPASSWLALGSPQNAFRQLNHMLVIMSAPTGPTRFVPAVLTTGSTASELLARMRIVYFQGSDCLLGGLGFGLDSAEGSGLSLQFQVGADLRRFLAWKGPGTLSGPRAAYAWQTNTWYWVRLRHQTNAIGLYPDLFARVWPADGETAEPSYWTCWWDYFPSLPHQKGAPGFEAGLSAQGMVECDFLLWKEESLPVVDVRLPALKPARPSLFAEVCPSPHFFRLRLTGSPLSDYVVEASSDFESWTIFGLLTDQSGSALFSDNSAIDLNHRFYRARCLQ
ncbi:MAG: hypothetical protein N3G20_00830, partial [Verrucomicrobiae bacterium]|nr:hypothetical protein [Verrucomicrobiae bacterium]